VAGPVSERSLAKATSSSVPTNASAATVLFRTTLFTMRFDRAFAWLDASGCSPRSAALAFAPVAFTEPMTLVAFGRDPATTTP